MDIPGNDRKAGFVFEPLLATVNDWETSLGSNDTVAATVGLFGNASKPSKSIFQDHHREIFLRDVWAVFVHFFDFISRFRNY